LAPFLPLAAEGDQFLQPAAPPPVRFDRKTTPAQQIERF
jgi:hypothetical protein